MFKKIIILYIFITAFFFPIPSLFAAEPVRLESLDSGEYIGKHIEYLNEKEVFFHLINRWEIDTAFKEIMLSGQLHSTDKVHVDIEHTPLGYKAVFQRKDGSKNTQHVEWDIYDILQTEISSAFNPSDKRIFMLNFIAHSYWLRFYVQNDSDVEEDLILEVDRHLFSMADMYIPRNDGTSNVERGDFIQPLDDRGVKTKNIAFHIEAKPGINTIFLRVDSKFIDFVPLRLWLKNDFHQYVARDASLLGIISGIFVFICFFNMFIFFSTRDRSYMYLSMMSLCSLGVHISSSGLGLQILWPNHPITGFSVLYISLPLSYAFFLLFCRSFIDIPHVTMKMDRILMGMIVFFAAAALSFFMFPLNVKIWIFGLIIILEYIYYLPILYPAIIVTRKGNRTGLFLLIGTFLYLFSLVEWLLSSFDILPFRFINYIHIKGVLLLFIMTLGLADKINSMKKSLADSNISLEYKVSQRTLELVEKTDELIQANKKLKELDKLKSSFFANISHELRTPLTLISSPIQSFIKGNYGPISEKGVSIFMMMQRNLDRLLKLINNILDFSKIEAQKMSAKLLDHDISHLLTYCVSSANSSAEAKGIDLVFTDHTGRLIASVDSELIEKAIFNLLSNAIKFTEPGGSIRVDLKKTNEEMEISVQDSGIGISEQDRETIFERFSQVDSSSTRKYEGTGIGLSLTKEIIQLHGGEITVSSQPNKGSEFIVRIPTLTNKDLDSVVSFSDNKDSDINTADANQSVSENLSLDGSAVATEPDSVLIVEDNEDMRDYLTSLLENTYQIITAVNGKDALDKLDKIKFDLVLADIMMPEMDGYDLIKTIRSNETYSNIPVILISARSDMQDKVRGIELGANDYIVKPFNPEELLARITSQMKFKRLRQRLLETDREKKTAKKSLTEKTKVKIEVVKDFLKENYSDDISREQMASAIEMSPDHLGRMFKEYTGEKLSDHLNRIRIDEAKKKLLETDDKIIAVAFDVGFGSLRSFNKAFMDLEGVTPSHFRKTS